MGILNVSCRYFVPYPDQGGHSILTSLAQKTVFMKNCNSKYRATIQSFLHRKFQLVARFTRTTKISPMIYLSLSFFEIQDSDSGVRVYFRHQIAHLLGLDTLNIFTDLTDPNFPRSERTIKGHLFNYLGKNNLYLRLDFHPQMCASQLRMDSFDCSFSDALI